MKHKIVLVPFPFDDLSGSKVRPAACLTHPIGEHGHIIIAFITSKVLNTPLETDLIFQSNDPDFKLTGLRVSSTLQLHRLMTISSKILRRELGELSSSMQMQVEERLRKLFDLQK